MSGNLPGNLPLPTWPISLDYFTWPTAFTLFLALALPVVCLGYRSLSHHGGLRQWVSISLRLAVIALAVLILGGARWNQPIKDLEVLVLRDTSGSSLLVQNLPGNTLESTVHDWLQKTTTPGAKPGDDRIGVIRFARNAQIEAMPARHYFRGAAAIPDAADRDATDVASALQLASATMSGEALHRIVLLWDGNQTSGNLEAAASQAAARHIPIDVMPLEYSIANEVIAERLDAPTLKREGEPFSVRFTLRSTNSSPVTGRVSFRDRGHVLDIDPRTPGLQTSRAVTLTPGINIIPIEIDASESGVRDLQASFEADEGVGDTLLQNNSARAFTFVKGKGRVLYVDNVANDSGQLLIDALERQQIGVRAQRINARAFPRNLADLQSYDAVILANVPRGFGGLDSEQERILASYVHDLGGGLVVVGGPDALGAGGWIGSKLEEVLPVDCSIPAKRVLPSGLLVLVLDHSGSMGETVRGTQITKQAAVNQAAVLAVGALSKQDWVGVVSFDSAAQWVVPVRQNANPRATVDAIRQIGTGGGTEIPAGLELACEAVEKLGPDQVSIKHVLLLTDGQSRGAGYDELLARLHKAGASLSTIGVGDDVNPKLLADLAHNGKGRYYPIADPTRLPQVFIKEARTIHRSLILERPFTPLLHATGSPLVTGLASLPPLRGLVLATPKANPNVVVPLVSPDGDPVLAHWQAGLGHVAVFTSDATNVWASAWTASDIYDRFWAQTVRWALRPPINSDFEVLVSDADDAGQAKVTVIASSKAGAATDFLRFAGQILGPDLVGRSLHLNQTGPGRYEGKFSTGADGNYVGLLQYHGANGESGTIPIGKSVESSSELRVLSSNNAAMLRLVNQTGGRMLRPWDADSARLFTREGLPPQTTSLPAWDRLIILMIALFLLDVGARRIAWSKADLARATAAAGTWVRSFTTLPKSDARPTLDALRQVRGQSSTRITGANNPVAESPTLSPKPQPRQSLSPESGGVSGLKAAKRRALRRFDQNDEAE